MELLGIWALREYNNLHVHVLDILQYEFDIESQFPSMDL